MAKVKYYAKENSTIGTHSFYRQNLLATEGVALAFAQKRMQGLKEGNLGTNFNSASPVGCIPESSHCWPKEGRGSDLSL